MWAFDGDRVTVAQKYKASLLEHKDNATHMIECFINYASHYKTKHVLFTLGSDFTFQQADVTYKYIDLIV